jgi:predicted nucleic acid-binding protein
VAVIVDSSVVVDALGGEKPLPVLRAIAEATLVLPPLVVAEVFSGDTTPEQREEFGILLQDYPVLRTPLKHWMDLGELRRTLRAKGLNVTLPDAHVAQCALDLDATVLSRDEIFVHIAAHTSLRVLR